MLRVCANDTDNTIALNNLTLITNGLYAGSYFHKSPPRESDTCRRIMAARNELQFDGLSNIPQIPKLILQVFKNFIAFSAVF